MVFSSITFLFYFLPLFLAAYFLLPARNLVFLLFSLAFYVLGEGPYVVVLLISIGLNYGFALAIEGETTARGRGSRRWVSLGIAVNLGLLGVYKYGDFLLIQAVPLLRLLHMRPLPPLPLHLPLGISFFTFHAISYLVDVQRGDAKAERDLSGLALYIAMFPQLIAGPIVRFKTIVGEIHARGIGIDDLATGIRIFSIGLAQKALIANTLAGPADRIFLLPPGTLTTSVAWLGVIAYGLQLYFDFCGYSLMAIGLARVLGLHFPQNFDHPYVSRSITEFWRRWHMTLSAWFRDYVYIPLGGNRGGRIRTYRNLVIVFFLCGLWHGAAWTFILWGLYHGLFLVLERVGLGPLLRRVSPVLAHAYALPVIFCGWVLFRSADLAQAGSFFAAMAGLQAGRGSVPLTAGSFLSPDVQLAFAAALLGSMPIVPWISARLRQWPGALAGQAAALLGVACPLALLVLSAATMVIGSYSPFLYFRF